MADEFLYIPADEKLLLFFLFEIKYIKSLIQNTIELKIILTSVTSCLIVAQLENNLNFGQIIPRFKQLK